MAYKFKQTKYTKWYNQIIQNRQCNLLNNDIYGELHHIIPKSLGGSNLKSNLVKLTAREHFIVHLLLIRMVHDNDVYRMIHAIIRFKAKIQTSREFNLLRTTLHTYSKGKYNYAYGRIWIHTINDHDIKYIKKEEFNPATLQP